MSSVSSTSSLGNTSLSGFGGLVSGLDRDALIEQLTASTQNKIDTANKDAKTLGWKQEAYRSITTKVISLEDDYLSYTGTNSLKNPSFFAADQLTAQGEDESTRNIKATGTSDMLKYLQIEGVKQTATAATLVSKVKSEATSITTASLTNLATGTINTGSLGGKTLVFGTTDKDGNFNKATTFTLPTSYTKMNGDESETVTIDYTADAATIAEQLNEALINNADHAVKIGSDDNNMLDGTEGHVRFAANENGALVLQAADNTSTLYKIGNASTALEYMGYTGESKDGMDFNTVMSSDSMTDKVEDHQNKTTIQEYLSRNSVTMKLGSTSKSFSLLTSDQASAITEATKDISDPAEQAKARLEKIQESIQKTIDNNFGTGKIKAAIDDSGALSFTALEDADTGNVPTMTLTASNTEFKNNLGLSTTSSNKIATGASLKDSYAALGFSSEDELDSALEEGLSINGTKIDGITKDTTVSELMSKINKSGAGVKATYLSGSNQFMLLATNTGTGHEIQTEGKLAQTIFGTAETGTSKDGTNAVLAYSYGGSNVQTVSSDTNTFDIDGIKVTVSGEFGYEEVDGQKQLTTTGADAVTFTSAANVDKVTETVKKFIEAYNAMVEEVNTQATTKPNRDYTALTDDEEDELTEKQLEKWNEKAKTGILYQESTITEMHNSLEGVMTKLLQNGISYDDLESMGISMSEDVYDGGKINFDEEKFKSAMQTEPEKVSDVFTGTGSSKGLVKVIEDTLTPYATRYATRNGGSYGRLVEEAGADELKLANTTNQIYKQLQEMSDKIDKFNEMLSAEQTRYTNQFTALEKAISTLNDQSSYLSNIQS